MVFAVDTCAKKEKKSQVGTETMGGRQAPSIYNQLLQGTPGFT